MVEDKVTKMRESLRLMSLSRFNYTMSIFIFQTMFAVVSAVIFAGGLYGDKNIFPDDPTGNAIMFGFAIFLFALGSIPFCMALSTLFQDSKIANQVGGMLLLLPELVFLYLATKKTPTAYVIYALYWLPVVPSCHLFTYYCTNHDPKYLSDSFIHLEWTNLPVVWAASILNVPFWIIMYQYFDSIMPSEYGISKHPCFCFMKQKRSKVRAPQNLGDLEDNNKVFSEADPIKLDGLTKMFGDFKAVSDLKFSIKEGEIFTFLGHNGAGKTTTIYMMTGMLKPSEGDANIYGYSVTNNSDTVQKNLGLCQQFDVLFETLTCKEHLILVCELKNMEKDKIEAAVKDTIGLVMLTEHQDK
jgi:ABC-type multidrug transport system fused ATPase/permease subunit